MDTNKQEFESINSEKYDIKVKEVIESMQKDFFDTTPNDIGLSLADLQNILNKKGTLYAVESEYIGENEALKFLEFFMKDSSFDIESLNKISSVLISFRTHSDYPITKLTKMIELISERINDESNLIWGTVRDDSLDNDLAIINGLFTETQAS